jgi:derlin-1
MLKKFLFCILFRLLVQLCGIVVGHLYFFLVFKYPQDFGGANFLKTPSFLYV